MRNMADMELEVDINDSINTIIERSASAPSSPTEGSVLVLRDIGTIGNHCKGRRVTFPDDDTIVTGYFEAPDPWSEEYTVSTDNIVAAYRAACWKQGVKPLLRVLQQLQTVQLNETIEFELNLKGENLDSQHCEALEEIFKRLQFKTLELENCHLDDEGAAAIFDMIEYYDSTTHLNISCNRGISNQGWLACSKMLKKTPCLQYLDARNTAQNEQSLLILGRAFRTGSNLVILHLENCSLFGRPLVILVAALKLNTALLELYLGENKISSSDGLQLGNLLRSNSTLELLDLKCNNLQDLGICHLMDGLCQQTPNNGECLKTLVLSNNHLTQNGMAHVNRSLLVCGSLEALDMSHNNICNEGIHLLKQGLLNNQTLQYLGLQNAKITCEGAVALAEYIADNQRITHLDLRENNIKVAGLMALALSMRHNHSIMYLDLDLTIKVDTSAPDGVHNHQRLLQEIQEYCFRNKSENDENEETEKNVNFSVQNYIPTIHNDAELSSVFREKTAVHRTQSVNVTHSPPIGMVVSASFPAGSKVSQFSTSPRNRFQVCRVFLDGDKRNSSTCKNSESSVTAMYTQGACDDLHSPSDESVFLNTAPNETSEATNVDNAMEHHLPLTRTVNNGVCKTATTPQGIYVTGHSADGNDSQNVSESNAHTRVEFSSEIDHSENVDEEINTSIDSTINDGSSKDSKSLQNPSHGNLKSQLPSHKSGVNKVTKKISFLLAEEPEVHSHNKVKDRRMSTPALASTRLINQQHKFKLKLNRQLESLDLRSSVPLSPTRLREGLLIPEPFDLKLPPEIPSPE